MRTARTEAEALLLLRRLEALDVQVSRLGDRLLVEGPAEHVTDALRDEVRRLKPALLQALPPSEPEAGCGLHDVAAAAVRAWWVKAAELGATVSACSCCGAPAPEGGLVCKFCHACIDCGVPCEDWAPLCEDCLEDAFRRAVAAGGRP